MSESLAIPQGPKKMDCPEDIDFLSALDKMVSENIQERMKEPVKAGNVDISVPVVLKSNIKKTYEQLQVSWILRPPGNSIMYHQLLNIFLLTLYISLPMNVLSTIFMTIMVPNSYLHFISLFIYRHKTRKKCTHQLKLVNINSLCT